VTQVSLEHGLDPLLVDALVQVESGYDPSAVSRKGAMGLMQLMPQTARRLNVSNPFDPEQNVRAGVREFQRLIDRYSGDLVLALAAYNAGEGAVARFGGVPPYDETRRYVVRILSMYNGRPYQLPVRRRRPSVRMHRDPQTGQTVISNIPAGSGPAVVSSPSAPGGALGGGFGSSQ
jgi:hypothetical protein